MIIGEFLTQVNGLPVNYLKISLNDCMGNDFLLFIFN